MSSLINTKLLFEYKVGHLIGLGFGDIINSNADLLVVSAFDIPSFTPNSSIGSLNELLKKNSLASIEETINESFGKEGFQLFDYSESSLPFKKILLVCMGSRQSFKTESAESLAGIVLNNLKQNLEKARILLSKEKSAFTVDITALGTRYGGLRRKESFDMLINWAADLFSSTNKVTLLRYVAYDLDTFVDFFESIYRLQKMKPENELIFSATYDVDNLSVYKGDIKSALRNLDENPKGVIITCRSIIESIVKTRVNDTTIRLVDGIKLLKETCPPNIYSYLTTCRILGNFSNHDTNFIPTRRDAEGILLLTLRIVEWHVS